MRLADPLDDALDDLRISGSVLVHEAYQPPWAVDVPTESTLRRLLGVGPDMRVLPFHLTRRGGFDLSREGETVGRVEAPELLLLPGGSAHRLSHGDRAPSAALEAILSDTNQNGTPKDKPGATELICGAFAMRAAPLNPLLGALPPALKGPAGGAEASPALAGALRRCWRRSAGGVPATDLPLSAFWKCSAPRQFVHFSRVSAVGTPAGFEGWRTRRFRRRCATCTPIPAQIGAWTRWRRGLRCLPPASRLVSERPWGKASWPMSADGASTSPVAFSARRSRLLIASPSASDMRACRRLAARSKLRSVAHPPNGVETRGPPSRKVGSLLNSERGSFEG
jgi:hypothetical protein